MKEEQGSLFDFDEYVKALKSNPENEKLDFTIEFIKALDELYEDQVIIWRPKFEENLQEDGSVVLPPDIVESMMNQRRYRGPGKNWEMFLWNVILKKFCKNVKLIRDKIEEENEYINFSDEKHTY